MCPFESLFKGGGHVKSFIVRSGLNSVKSLPFMDIRHWGKSQLDRLTFDPAAFKNTVRGNSVVALNRRYSLRQVSPNQCGRAVIELES